MTSWRWPLHCRVLILLEWVKCTHIVCILRCDKFMLSWPCMHVWMCVCVCVCVRVRVRVCMCTCIGINVMCVYECMCDGSSLYIHVCIYWYCKISEKPPHAYRRCITSTTAITLSLSLQLINFTRTPRTGRRRIMIWWPLLRGWQGWWCRLQSLQGQ